MSKLNFLILIIALSLIGCNSERTTFEITGTVTGAPENTQVTLYTAVGDTLAVSKLVDGKFSVKGSVTEPSEAYLTFGIPYCSLVLENDTYSTNIQFDDKTTFVLQGGHLNDMVNKYKQDPVYVSAMNELKTFIEANKDVDESDKEAVDIFMKEYQAKSKFLSKISGTYYKEIIDGEYSDIEKFYALKNNSSQDYSMDVRIALVKEYKENGTSLKDMDKYIESLESYKKSMEMSKTVGVGSNYKEVIAITNADEEVKLSEVIAKNEYTLLEFWASWCGPCRAEFPHLKKAYNHYKEKGFEIYGISVDGNQEKWLKAEKEEDIPWISVVDLDARESKATKAYGVLGIPASFLISKEGKIVASGNEIRGVNLDEKLKELLGE